MPALEDTIWWHVYPLGAVGAPARREHPQAQPAEGDQADDGSAQHRLLRLVPWLDHVVDLGCDGLLLGPIFESVSHGYDTLDHLRIDPRLGTEDDWDSFVVEARRRGLRILLDGVFNHVSVEHPLVARTLAEGHGPVRTLERDGHRIPRPWEGHPSLAELDHSSPEVEDLVVEVMLHWLRRGADGWRLDVAYAVPSDFWARVLPRVRAEFPEALFLGEVIHGDYTEIARAGTLDAVTQYELWKGIWSSLVDRNLWELAWALQRHEEFAAQTLMQTFVGNHDVTRIATTVGPERAALAVVLLLTLPGMPSIYYGDEVGLLAEKGASWDADLPLRPELPGSPAELLGGPDGRGDSGGTDGGEHGRRLLDLHRELIRLRREHPWLTRGHVEVLDRTNETITYRVAGAGGDAGRVLEVDLHVDGRARVVVGGAERLVVQP